MDNMTIGNEGMNSLSFSNEVKINILPKPVLNSRCWCSDIPPSSDYTCVQQSQWGKCNETWMKGYCCQSCFACVDCT